MADLKDINKVLKRFEHNFYRQIGKAQIQIAKKVMAKLAASTPVDTGRCQSNWSISGSQSDAPYNPQPLTADARWGDKRGISYLFAKARAREDGQRLQNTIVSGKRFSPIYIHNPTPYLKYLDKGWSTQAPAGFIRSQAIAEYHKQIRTLNDILGDTLGVRVSAGS